MNGNPTRNEPTVENGNLLRLGEYREIAIYLRGGAAWVADFRGVRGELFTARGWFALNGRASLLRRAGLASITPLPAEVIERIARLHGAGDRAPLAALAAWLRNHLARFSRQLSRCAGALSPRTQQRSWINQGGPTMLARTFIFLYGIASYAVFLVSFLYAIGFVGNLWVPK